MSVRMSKRVGPGTPTKGCPVVVSTVLPTARVSISGRLRLKLL